MPHRDPAERAGATAPLHTVTPAVSGRSWRGDVLVAVLAAPVGLIGSVCKLRTRPVRPSQCLRQKRRRSRVVPRRLADRRSSGWSERGAGVGVKFDPHHPARGARVTRAPTPPSPPARPAVHTHPATALLIGLVHGRHREHRAFQYHRRGLGKDLRQAFTESSGYFLGGPQWTRRAGLGFGSRSGHRGAPGGFESSHRPDRNRWGRSCA